MALTATNVTNTYPAPYFLQNDPQGNRKPISSLELSGLWIPQKLGYVMANELNRNSLLTELTMKGRELYVSDDQVMWREEGDYLHSLSNKAKFTSGTKKFEPSPDSFPADVHDMDTSRPEDVEWISVTEGLHFTVFDKDGVQNWGVVKSVAADNKSFIADPIGSDEFTIGEDVEVIFTTLNMKDCECPPSVRIKNYAPTYSNTLAKDGIAIEYCEETMIKEGNAFDFIPTREGEVTVDERLNDALKMLQARVEANFAFGKQLTDAEATALGTYKYATNGVMPYLETRATKIEGMLETIADYKLLASILKKQKVFSATIKMNAAQFDKAQELFPTSSAYHIDPFTDHSSDLIYLGFRGISIHGVKLYFSEWSALDDASEYAAKKYNFVVIPEGTLRRKINGKVENVGYINVAYFSGNGKVWKMLREDKKADTSGYCGIEKVNYYTTFAPVVFMPRKFIIGINVA